MGICEIHGIAREGDSAGKIISQTDKPHQDVMANKSDSFRSGQWSFIDRLDSYFVAFVKCSRKKDNV